MRRIGSMKRSHLVTVGAITAVFVATRVLVAVIPFGLTDYPAGELTITDLNLYAYWSGLLTDGQFPVGDPMWQYPPLAAALFAVSGMVADPVVGFMTLAVIADAAAMAALLVVAVRRDRFAGAWLWSLAAVVVGPIFLARFDVVPAAAAIIGLLIVARSRTGAGAAFGLGAMLKVWPVLGLLAVPRTQLPRALVGFGIAVASASLAMWALFGSASWSFLAGQSGRGLQVESVAALPFLWARSLGAGVTTEFRYGSVEVDAAGAGVAAGLFTVAGVVLLGALVVARLTGRLETIPGADVVMAAVLVAVLTSRVFSPQFSIWLLAVGAAALASRRSSMGGPVALVVAAAALAQAIFPLLYGEVIGATALGVTVQTARIGLIVAATCWALWAVLGRRRRELVVDPGHTEPLEDDQSSGSIPSSRSVNRSETMSQRQNSSIH